MIFERRRNNEELAKIEKLTRAIFLRGEERGRDSYGIVSVSKNGSIKEIKKLGKVSDSLFFEPSFIDESTVIVLNNDRAEPTTEYVNRKTPEDIQPFVSNGFVVAHNGTIANDKELEKELQLNRKTRIDSAIFPPLLEKLWDGSLEGLRSILVDSVMGSYALAVVDLRRPTSLFLAVNYKPLFLQYDAELDTLFFSSLGAYMEDISSPVWLAKPIKQLKPYSAVVVDSTRGFDDISLWRNPVGKKALVVCSAGLDSTTAAKLMLDKGYEVTLLHFKYSHRAQEREHSCIIKISERLKVPLLVIDTDLFKKHLYSSPLMDKDKQISSTRLGESGAEFAHEWVPARNLIFLSIATGLAEEHGFDYLVLGNNLEESGAYSDNEMMFVQKLNELLPYSTNLQKRVEVLMPVGNLMKHEIVKLGLQIDAPLELTWSCYEGNEKHCGKCGPCYMRRKAFEIIGVSDPVDYLV
jgi:7-cyano-7-deazaguanine synthase